jgi:transaldolase
VAPAATFVIVGAGLAGAKAAEALRDQGFNGRIVLLGDEPHRPYERPPLSKDYLIGKLEREQVFVHPAAWYGEHDVDLRTGQAVTAIDRAAHQVTLADGSHVGYDRLLLATGSSPRRLPVPGADADGVYYLRRIEDSEQINDTLATASRVAVIGGGWIGLEVAAAARQAGVQVVLIEAAELPLLGVLGPQVAQVFADLHRDHGVDLRCGTQITAITTAITTGNGTRKATGVRLADGTTIGADAVIVGVGVSPNTQLAADAGLKVDNGVLVDAALATSDPGICAVGDVANAFHPVLGRQVRVEHWANALNQPATAAARMLGHEAVHDTLPYFYTDQYDLGMEYVGYVEPGGYDQVIFRGDVPARQFIAFWCKQNRVLAGMNVNMWEGIDPLLAARQPQRTRRPRLAPGPAHRPMTTRPRSRLPGQIPARMEKTMNDVLRQLSGEGVAVWLDDLSRERLAGGNLATLIQDRHVAGITSNPTIFAKAIIAGTRYDDQLTDLARREVGVEETVRLLTAFDVRWACDLLRPVWEVTDGVDGRASIEVDPRIAHDTAATLAEARALWWLVDRPNLFVKIPATAQGIGAISAALAEGISINVTLIFSLDRYDQVTGAFLDGMQAAHAAGRDLSAIASVASFFVSRVDTEVDQRLDKLGTPQGQALRGKAAIANARLAYQHYEQTFATARWKTLAAAGARPQRPLWASTGVKDPSYDDTRYVTELVAPGVVNTMPEQTLQAVAEHGEIHGDTIHGTYPQSRRILDELEEIGVPYHDVVRILENEGITKFTHSWHNLSEAMHAELRGKRAQSTG